jgi:hypothetical protein
MIRFWVRELMGWLLVIVGLGIFYLCIGLMLSGGAEILIEGPPVILIGIIVFRGGIHLLKVAVAARVCMHTHAEAQKPPVSQQVKKKAETPWDW